ncbi:2-amino-4-hydroxy-6-hydroxymethyldihydropteridine diphosphokinase [Arcticibacter sp.]|uniref:2-amino-4-hydroxy-6- hydroxymethyldihydropteridine diphosphokinase n=1 Tax=Arcticibacter sp. TaxID=1872630 RepID=UPI00388F5BDF
MHSVFILLGSNLGDRLMYLHKATISIEREAGKVLQKSAVYRTESWGKADLPEYLNQVLQIESALRPQALLATLQQIEADLERKREEKWGSRTIDIDILFYDEEQINEPHLIIPHPLMQERRFVLEPLMEIAPSLEHPVFGKTVKQLYAQLKDTLIVEKI